MILQHLALSPQNRNWQSVIESIWQSYVFETEEVYLEQAVGDGGFSLKGQFPSCERDASAFGFNSE